MPVGRVSARGRRRALVRPAAARHRLPWRAPARPAPRARRAHHTASVSLPASVLHTTWSAAGLIATVAHTANTTHRCRPSPRLALCPLTCACPEPGRGRRCPDWPRRLPTPLPTHKPATAIAPLTPPALIGIAQPPPRHRVSPWIHGPSVPLTSTARGLAVVGRDEGQGGVWTPAALRQPLASPPAPPLIPATRLARFPMRGPLQHAPAVRAGPAADRHDHGQDSGRHAVHRALAAVAMAVAGGGVWAGRVGSWPATLLCVGH